MFSITRIFFILDRSGSMWETLNDTIGGFNTFVSSQQKDNNGKCFLSLYQFDHEYNIVYENKLIDDVEFLTDKTFVPRGQTSLLDAIGRTINSISASDNNSSNNIIVILTDGYENSSKEFDNTEISNMIKLKENDGWKFVFLAANQDAVLTASNLGIKRNSAMTYSQTPENVRSCFNGLSEAISRTRTGEDDDVTFTNAERYNSQN